MTAIAAAPRALILPRPPAPAFTPALPPGFSRSPSGLLLPGSGPAAGSDPIVLAPRELHGDLSSSAVLEQVRRGYEELAQTSGRQVADFRYREALDLIDTIAAQERHERAIALFNAGTRLSE